MVGEVVARKACLVDDTRRPNGRDLTGTEWRRRSSAATSSICASAAWRRASSVAALPRRTATALNKRDDGTTLVCEGAVGDARSAARSIVCGGGGGAGGGRVRAGVGFTNVVDVDVDGGGLAGARGGFTGAAPWV